MHNNTFSLNATLIFLRILRRTGLLKYLNITLRLNQPGGRLRVPLMGTVGFEHFSKEKEMWMRSLLNVFYNVTRGAGVFVDVGANIGQTLLKVKAVNRHWEYLGFEPNPNCLRYLQVLINKNGFSNTTLLPFGLSDETRNGNLDLFSASAVDTYASIVPGFRSKVVRSIDIAIINGKEVFENFKKPVAVLKVDVEGGELEVIRGLKSMIGADQPFIICEVLPVYDASNQVRLGRQLALEKLMDDLNYDKFRVTSEGKLIPCREIGIHADLDQVNYLFAPRKASEVLNRNFEVLR